MTTPLPPFAPGEGLPEGALAEPPPPPLPVLAVPLLAGTTAEESS